MRLILGSSSKYRQQILRNLGFDFEVRCPDIDEKAIRRSDPEELTLAIAQAKAAALLSGAQPGDIVMTSDQVVVQTGRILEKPKDKDDARRLLEAVAVAPVETVGAIVVTDVATGRQVSGSDHVSIVMEPLPSESVERLLVEGDTYHCAGGFRVEHPLIVPHIISMDGEVESVMGLSPRLVLKLLQEIGYLSEE